MVLFSLRPSTTAVKENLHFGHHRPYRHCHLPGEPAETDFVSLSMRWLFGVGLHKIWSLLWYDNNVSFIGQSIVGRYKSLRHLRETSLFDKTLRIIIVRYFVCCLCLTRGDPYQSSILLPFPCLSWCFTKSQVIYRYFRLCDSI